MNTLFNGNETWITPQEPRPFIYLGLLPVLLSLFLVIELWRFPPAFGVYEPHFLLPIFNTILFLAAAIIAYIAWRSYLLSGSATTLWLGSGVLALGTGALAAGWLIYPFGPNFNVTIFNVAVLLAAIFHTGGVLASLDEEAGRTDPERRPWRVTMAYLAVLAAIALLLGLTLGGVMPLFFIQGQGPTVLRQYVVEWSIVLLTFTSLLIMMRFRRRRSAFLYWYSLALALMAIAMLAFFLQTAVGSLIGWVGRISYLLAAIYFLISVSTAWGQARSLGVDLSKAMAELFGPEQSRALFDNLNESLVVNELLFDEKGKPCDWRILNVNPAYLKTTGKSQDEVVGRRLSETFGIDRAPEPFLSWFAQVVETGKPIQVEGYFEPLRKHLQTSAFHLGGSRYATLVADITERKQAEAALERAREQLAEGQRIAHLGSWEYIAATQTTVWSDEEKRIYGLDPTQPSPAYELMLRHHIHPDDAAELDLSFREAVQHGAPFENGHRIIRPDGTVRWVYNKAQPYFDEHGKLLRYIGTTLDITERKQAEEALRILNKELEQRVEERTAQLVSVYGQLDAFFTHSITPMVFLDKNFNFIKVNEAYARACQRPVEDFPGHNHFEFYPHEENRVIFAEVLRTKKPHQAVAKPFKFPDHPEWGVTYWDWTLMPILDETDQVDFLVFSLNDVTERHRAEEALARHVLLVQDLYNNAPCGYHSLDPAGNFVQINDTELTWLGYSREEVVGRMNITDLLTPDSQKIFRQNFPGFMERGWVKDLEFRLKRKDGTFFPILLSATAVTDDEGNFLMSRSTAYDITERQRAEQALRESEERLRFLAGQLLTAQEQERKRLAGELHDELGHALLTLKFSLGAIARKLPPEQENIQELIQEQLEYINHVIEEVRRLYHDLSPGDLEDLGLNKAVENLVEDFGNHQPNISWEVDLPDLQGRFSLTVETIIYRLVQEALTNIGKYAEPSQVSISAKEENQHIRMIIEDDGHGFDLAEVDSNPNRGVGLAAMRERLYLVGGSLDIWSQKEQGTRLTFTIPTLPKDA